MKENKNLLQIIVVAIFVVAFIVISLNFVQLSDNDDSKWNSFVIQTYTSLDVISSDLDNLIVNKPQNDELKEMIHQTENNLLTAHHLNQNAYSFLDKDIYAVTYFDDISGLFYGVDISGDFNKHILPFAEDGKLSEEEISILKIIKNDIDNSIKAMNSKDTNQEHAYLNIREYNEIISTNFNKNVVDVYRLSTK